MAAFSLIDLLFSLGVAAVLSAMAIPSTFGAVDDARATAAVQYLASRLQRTRMEATASSASAALRFTRSGTDYTIASYRDGNRNGVLTRDIQSGIDHAFGIVDRIEDQFPGVRLGTLPGLPPVDSSSSPPGLDPVRLGGSDMAVFTPFGTATSGSLYVLGRGQRQFVVRILGDTGRTRVLRFNLRTQQWTPLGGS
jgi:type II secretory pathway pseudopilin PulG